MTSIVFLTISQIPPKFNPSFRRIKKALTSFFPSIKANISISFVSEHNMKILNQRARNIDSPATVLSFPFFTSEEMISLFPSLARLARLKAGVGQSFSRLLGQDISIGQLVFCPSIIRKQAHSFRTGEQEHFQKLFIHGFLHLLGFHHDRTKDHYRMERIERRLFQLIP